MLLPRVHRAGGNTVSPRRPHSASNFNARKKPDRQPIRGASKINVSDWNDTAYRRSSRCSRGSPPRKCHTGTYFWINGGHENSVVEERKRRETKREERTEEDEEEIGDGARGS